MKLSIIYCVTTPIGMSYLATDGDNYYVKGVHDTDPEKFNSLCNAMSSYIGTLHYVIGKYGVGCEQPDLFGTEVAL